MANYIVIDPGKRPILVLNNHVHEGHTQIELDIFGQGTLIGLPNNLAEVIERADALAKKAEKAEIAKRKTKKEAAP